MSAIISALTQQITMEYAGEKTAPSEARGTWKCPWILSTLVINKYFKQRAVTALKSGRIALHMQKRCPKLVSVRAQATYMPPIP